MRIAFIGQKGIPASQGGIERHVEELARHLAARGHQVLVYSRTTYQKGPGDLPSGIEIVELPSIPIKAIDTIVHVLLSSIDVLFRRVDVVHYHHMGPAFFIGLVKLLRPSLPVVFTHHCDGTNLPYWGRLARLMMRWGERVGVRSADKVLAVNPVLTQDIASRYPSADVSYIPSGVTALLSEDQADASVALPKKYILAVSRIIQAKGLDHLVRAYNLISDDYPDCDLVIVGSPTKSDNYLPELRKLAAFNPRIHFLGQQSLPALSTIYRKASLFVQPSEIEGLPITLLEAASTGVPVIVSDIPEHTLVLQDEGVKFRSRNYIDLAARMRSVLQHLSAERQKTESLAARVTREFNWDTITAQIEEVYRSIPHSYNNVASTGASKARTGGWLAGISAVLRSLF